MATKDRYLPGTDHPFIGLRTWQDALSASQDADELGKEAGSQADLHPARRAEADGRHPAI